MPTWGDAAASRYTPASMQDLPRVRLLIEQGISEGHHPGAQVCVHQDGRCVAEVVVGRTAFAPDGEPLTPDHLTLWLSSGKPILAVALARQVEAGVLTWDDPVAEWVPEFAAGGKDAITLRHVLTHTGGFRSVAFRYPQQTWDEAVAAVCSARVETGWDIGKTAGYHPHSGWNILGRVLEVAADESLSHHLREAVLLPLGMTQTWVGMSDDDYDRQHARLSPMQNTAGRLPQPTGMHQRDWVTGQRPGGNTYGPARDLARFYRALLQGGEIDGTRILETDTVATLTQRHRRDTVDRTFRATMDWGLGLMTNNRRHDPANTDTHGDIGTPYNFGPYAGTNAFGHGGNQSSIGFADPEHQLAVAVIFNGMPGEPNHQGRMHTVLAALYQDLGLA